MVSELISRAGSDGSIKGLRPTYDRLMGEIDLAEFDRQCRQLDEQYAWRPTGTKTVTLSGLAVKI